MIQPSETTKIFLAAGAVDMRKSIDGLSVLVSEVLKQNPQSGHLFIFYNRNRNKIKCLCWDKNGFTIYYKRLEKRSFKIPRKIIGECIFLKKTELMWLLSGLDFSILQIRPELQLQSIYQ